MKTILTACLTLACMMPMSAQPHTPDHTAVKEALHPLSFLVGTWEGEGWMMMGCGQRSTSQVVETAQWKLDGTVLFVEGQGTRTDENGDTHPVHNALGIISYDAPTQNYLFRAYRSGGQYVDADVTMTDSTLVWQFEAPQAGIIRYTLSLGNPDQWTEHGETSRDGGTTWFPFFGMTLHRKD